MYAFKRQFFKMEMRLCLFLSTLTSRRSVCKIFVFPSVLPMSRKLTKIDGVLGDGRISNDQTPEEGKVNS